MHDDYDMYANALVEQLIGDIEILRREPRFAAMSADAQVSVMIGALVAAIALVFHRGSLDEKEFDKVHTMVEDARKRIAEVRAEEAEDAPRH